MEQVYIWLEDAIGDVADEQEHTRTSEGAIMLASALENLSRARQNLRRAIAIETRYTDGYQGEGE